MCKLHTVTVRFKKERNYGGSFKEIAAANFKKRGGRIKKM